VFTGGPSGSHCRRARHRCAGLDSAFRHSSHRPPRLWGTELGPSRREQQLVELLRERPTNKEIASQLNLSEQMVKNHVHNIMRKVGATDRLSAVRCCEIERGRTSQSA